MAINGLVVHEQTFSCMLFIVLATYIAIPYIAIEAQNLVRE